MNRAGLREHLVSSRLAGEVQTTPANTLANCAALARGEEPHAFGLSDWKDATPDDVVEAVRTVCGGPGRTDDPRPDGPGYIDPDRTLAALERHRERLAAVVGEPGTRVFIGTGHPTGLLPHYQAIARALQAAGVTLLTPAEGCDLGPGSDGRRRELRYLDGVACVSDGASLRHSHRARYAERVLDELGGGPGAVDLVLGDHGFAGAAIERGVSTLAIADVNDVALPLAQARGRTDAVLPIDDNLPPRLFVPVTEAILA